MLELTTEQATAIRSATDVLFMMNGTESFLRVGERPVLGTMDHYTDVPTAQRITSYGGGYPSGGRQGFWSLSTVQYDEVWHTIRRQIKRGSVLCLHWVYDNSSPVLEEAGLVRDELRLGVQNGTTTHWFNIAVQVGKDNTARMIRDIR